MKDITFLNNNFIVFIIIPSSFLMIFSKFIFDARITKDHHFTNKFLKEFFTCIFFNIKFM